jgi:hypothetical protein
VTRYKAGDLEIELGPRVPPEEGSAEWWRASTPEQLQEHRDRIGCIRETECTCYVCQAERRQPHLAGNAEPWPGAFEQLGKAAREAGYLKRHPAGESPEPDPPVDEQPPVEIDMAAVEEKLREQDAKRRGSSQ